MGPCYEQKNTDDISTHPPLAPRPAITALRRRSRGWTRAGPAQALAPLCYMEHLCLPMDTEQALRLLAVTEVLEEMDLWDLRSYMSTTHTGVPLLTELNTR